MIGALSVLFGSQITPEERQKIQKTYQHFENNWDEKLFLEFLETPDAKKGVNLEFVASLGRMKGSTITPLFFATRKNSVEGVKRLIEMKAQINAESDEKISSRDKLVRTASAVAIEKNNIGYLDLLLPDWQLDKIIYKRKESRFTSYQNDIYSRHYTPLGVAIYLKQKDVLRYLVFVRKVNINEILMTEEKKTSGWNHETTDNYSYDIHSSHSPFSQHIVSFTKNLLQTLKVRNLLLCARKDLACPFFEANFPLDLFKVILHLANLTLK